MYRIQPLDGRVDTAAFRCGQPALDDYICRYAAQDVRRKLSRVFVTTPIAQPDRIAGFFTLSAGSVQCADLPLVMAKKLPRYPVPVALLGRLAVAQDFQRQGLGAILLADACKKVAHASTTLAVCGMVVDAKDSAACHFYQRFGFLAMPGQASRLLLPAAAFEHLSIQIC